MTRLIRFVGSGLTAKVTLVVVLVLAAVSIAPGVQATPFPGPDAFGYIGSEIPNALRPLTPGATALYLEDDEAEGDVALGFSFSFYGSTYTTVTVSSNGFIAFDPDICGYCYDAGPIPFHDGDDDVDNMVAGFWTDLFPDDLGLISYETLGNAPNRQFVVEFYEVPYHDCIFGNVTMPVTMQMILHESTNNIELQYGAVSTCPQEISIGIENAAGTIGIQLFNGESSLASVSGRGFLFTTVPPACATMTFDRTIVGTTGNDTISGTGLRELIYGLGGHDVINGGAGNDCIVGGDGNDTLSGGSGNDKLLGGTGTDTIKGDSGTDAADGGAGSDNCDAESRTSCP